MKGCAGIVVFYPDIDRLKQNIEAVVPQVDKLYLVNNAPDDVERLHGVIAENSSASIVWIYNDKNLGIAGALNQLMAAAESDGFEWILTLDQDSICSDGFVDKLHTVAINYDGVAMVAPRVVERGVVWEDGKTTARYDEVEDVVFCITSGTLTNIASVKDIGGFDERLFIDEVDRDICIRLRRSGYRLLRVNAAELQHEFGDKLVHRRIFFKVYKYRNYSPFRVYYQVRNLVYMVRKYGADYKPYPAWRLVRPFFTFFVKFIFEPQRLKRLSAFVRGYAAGLTMKISN